MRLARTIGSLLKESAQAWSRDRVSRLAAALAYYTVFSLAPMLIIAIAIAGTFVGASAVQAQILQQIEGQVGPEVAQIVNAMLANISRPGSGTLAAGLSILTVIWAASNLFGQLQLALNTVWGVPPEAASGLARFAIRRMIAILMVIGVGVLLVLSLTAVTLISALNRILIEFAPALVRDLPLVDLLFSLGLMTVVFAAGYRILPNTSLKLSDVLPGAALTAVFFSVGKVLIGLYMANASFQSTYGAAGSLVALLVWIYYSAQIFLFGAEFTKIYTRRLGSHRRSGRQVAAIEAVVAATGEAAWPTLSLAGAGANAPQAGGDDVTPRWFLPALLAFAVGIVVGARRRPSRRGANRTIGR